MISGFKKRLEFEMYCHIVQGEATPACAGEALRAGNLLKTVETRQCLVSTKHIFTNGFQKQ